MTATDIWQELWSCEITEDRLREALAQLDDAPASLSVQSMRVQMLAQLARWDADREQEARDALDAMSALLDAASPSERLPACIHGFDAALALDDIPLSERFFELARESASGDDRAQVAVHYYNNLGCHLRNRGEFRQALTALHRALECAGPDADTTAVYYNLATVHARLHNVEEAKPYMELVADAWGLSDGWPDSHWFESMPAAVMDEIRERYGAG
jgi:tetratricopeptide (TPR) repeat protein